MSENFKIAPFERKHYATYSSWFEDPKTSTHLGKVNQEWLNHILTSQTGKEYVVHLDDQMIAEIGIDIGSPNDDFFTITNFTVNPTKRNQGLGSKALSFFLSSQSHNKGLKWRAHVSLDNIEAMNFFIQNNWSKTHIVDDMATFKWSATEEEKISILNTRIEDLYLIPIKISDSTVLRELMHRIYPPAYTYLWPDDCAWYMSYLYSDDRIKSDLKKANSLFYFISLGDQVEGILKIEIDEPYPAQPDKKTTHLHRIYISESLQGKGVALSMTNFVEEIAKKNKNELIWLDCMDSKLQALKFYEKRGFQKGRKYELPFEKLIEKYRGIYYMWKNI